MLVADPQLPSGLRVKLLDFGSARLGPLIASAADPSRPGLVMGTPLYLAPEQAPDGAKSGETITAKVDVYALGALFFELLTGRPPFTAESAAAVRKLHVTRPAPSVHEYLPTISRETATLIANMLEKEPKKRPSTGEVTQLLRLMGSSLAREQDTIIVPRSRRARSRSADSASSGKTEWIRRPAGAREPMTVQNRRRLIGLSAVLLLAGIGIVCVVVRSAYQSRVTAPAATATQDTEEGATTALPQGNPPTAAVPAMAPVSVSIKSFPSGAAVIDLEGEKKLGVTPFSASLDARDKDLWLVLRKDGFNERVVQVSLRHNSEWSEKLVRDVGPAHKPATRQTIEELKKKYESSSHGSDLAKPRIVD